MPSLSSPEYQPLTQSAAPSGQFRPQAWDPWLSLSQIGAVQAVFYVSATTFLAIGSHFLQFPLSLRYVFDPARTNISSSDGKWLIAMYFLNALILAFVLSVLVRRSKLCLDFVITCQLLHLISCWCYTSFFPSSVSWWLVQVMSAIVATFLGEYLCLRVEMEAIPLSQAVRSDV
ncbi:hypothetical protein RvY_07195 [Ramazzottius varieornatus]|uniref:Protein SYS1 homolog n=1 Tax=Ramazzottius varieornatus TaxID=947166 RepID=A0A1D1V6D1_RAMVA|nr:hypothetical protein RvY_07195 [Ramazzottius varieornatus]